MSESWGVSDVYQITDANYRGLLNVKQEILNPLYLEADKRGWQLTAHCTGEASPDLLLDCYENIAKEISVGKVRQQRFLITHANFSLPENFDKCKRLGISADIQPAWLYKDGASLLKILGERRMKNFQPLKTWFENDLVIGGGSDHMVQSDSFESTNPWNPWLGIWIAVTRQTERGGVDKSGQRLTREQAVRFYTLNSAYLHSEEKSKGSLEPGKLADLILIDRDILQCPADKIRGTKVLLTNPALAVHRGAGQDRPALHLQHPGERRRRQAVRPGGVQHLPRRRGEPLARGAARPPLPPRLHQQAHDPAGEGAGVHAVRRRRLHPARHGAAARVRAPAPRTAASSARRGLTSGGLGGLLGWLGWLGACGAIAAVEVN
jgi:hypothetical protein